MEEKSSSFFLCLEGNNCMHKVLLLSFPFLLASSIVRLPNVCKKWTNERVGKKEVQGVKDSGKLCMNNDFPPLSQQAFLSLSLQSLWKRENGGIWQSNILGGICHAHYCPPWAQAHDIQTNMSGPVCQGWRLLYFLLKFYWTSMQFDQFTHERDTHGL